MSNLPPRLGLPDLGLGVGLRHCHFAHILEHGPGVAWFEIISENFIDHYGHARHVLEQVAQKVPIVMHGVSLSIGSSDALNLHYLDKLKKLVHEIKPAWISDHLCWTGVASVNSHDLLPLPLTESSLRHVTRRVCQVQDILGRRLVLENPSSYMQFQQSNMPEWEFLSRVAEDADCGILLDVNNVYVSGFNHGFDAETYIRNLPHRRIVQMHVAGPTDCGDLLVDSHDHPVPQRVWELYALAQQLTGGVATLLEWDGNIPPYPELMAELDKARLALQGNIPQVAISPPQQSALSTPIHFHLAHQHDRHVNT